MKVLLFFKLNCYFKSEASDGKIQVFGKKLNSLLKTFCILIRFFDS